MFKRNMVYKLSQRERGQLEGLSASSRQIEANIQGLLKGIMEKQQIKAAENIVFDPKLMAFIRK